MRVLFLAHAFPRTPGDPAGAFLHLLACALNAIGVEVRVLAPHAPGLAERDVVAGVPVERFRYASEADETLAYTGRMVEEVRASLRGKRALMGLLAAATRASRRVMQEWPADVLHAQWWFPSGVSAAAATLRSPVPFVTTLHGSDVRLARGIAPARAAFRMVVSRAAAVTAVSGYLARTAREMAPAARLEVMPMPVDVERFGAPEPSVPREASALLFVGRLTTQKGVDRLLEALARLPRHVTLDVVGDGPERDRLRAHATSLGVAARVRWHGALAPAELPARYRSATAVVVPSHEEGLGLVAVEAILSGAPVVAFASGGLVDALDDGASGVLVPPGDVAALAAAIEGVLADPQRAVERARAGRERALARHAPAAAATRYLELYRDVVARR